ncbi:hypothetical protein HOLleu_39502 [Holothuria leucospilota]|uniref:Ig-like domain-containing protein n=1 Tax=Holothuria leucospilota TaxID=206669 RepID=A0A9Q0YG29_HOLLE|nr:hypothetical protein HOLleu_39502 [Holothuria leucospilota]
MALNMASAILIFLSVAVILPSSFTVNIQISFNASFYYSSEYTFIFYNYVGPYYAFEGDTVALNCSIPRGRGSIGIDARAWYERRYHTLVENGLIQSDETSGSRYSLESSKQTNTLVIRNLKASDSSFYRCWYNFIDWCDDWWYGPYRCVMTEMATAYLDVVETTTVPMESDFCDLVGSLDGVFFTGEDLILRCPTTELNITASSLLFKSTLISEFQNSYQNFYVFTLKNLTEDLNGTTLTCLKKGGGDETDYCRLLPNISVFNELTVTTSPKKVVVENGGNATIYCHSSPFPKAVDISFQWDFLDNKVTFGDFTESETSTGVQILIENIDFQNTTESSFKVICRVRAGSRNSSANTTVTRLSITSPRNPSIGATRPTTVPEDPITSSSPAIILVPLVAIVLILITVVSGIVYKKVTKPTNNTAKISNENEDTWKKNETIMDGNLYEKGDITKEKLGLTENDSEVVYNVAYVSYDAGDE